MVKEPRISSPRTIKEFIHLYKQNQCLWKTSHADYTNRDTKNEALLKLLPCVLRDEPEADINTVRKKINNLRTCYKREQKKVEQSKMADSGGSIYIPKLWYYNRLVFLDGTDEVTDEVADEVTDEVMDEVTTDLDYQDVKDDTIYIPDVFHEQEDEKYIVAVTSESSISEPENISPTPPNPLKLLKRKNENILRGRLTERKLLRSSASNGEEDEFDNVGKIVAMKLRKLPDRTKIIAERLIHEILYRAQLGNIAVNSIIVTPVEKNANTT